MNQACRFGSRYYRKRVIEPAGCWTKGGRIMGFQVGSTLLDACVLAVLSRGDTYGYVLTQTMRDVTDISESTLYPVLRRLQKDGYLTTYDQPYQGRNRRYYTITEDGRKKFEGYKQDWIRYKIQVDILLCGGDDNEQV